MSSSWSRWTKLPVSYVYASFDYAPSDAPTTLSRTFSYSLQSVGSQTQGTLRLLKLSQSFVRPQ